MTVRNLIFAVMASLTSLAVVNTSGAAGPAPMPVTILLRETGVAVEDLIRVRDVADLRGGGATIREQIAELDLAVASNDGSAAELTRELIDIRLQLAGILPEQYRLGGAVKVVVHRRVEGAEDFERRLIESIRNQLAARFLAHPEDVEVALSHPVPMNAFGGHRIEEIGFRPILPLHASVGGMRTKVDIMAAGNYVQTIDVPIEVRLFRSVARAVTRIAKGEDFTADNVIVERIPVTRAVDGLRSNDLVGNKARRTIPPATVIREEDIDQNTAENPVLIHPRDTIRLVAKKGALNVVVPAAEALEQGREGDMIRVRNNRSKLIVVGRVVNSSEVQVSF